MKRVQTRSVGVVGLSDWLFVLCHVRTSETARDFATSTLAVVTHKLNNNSPTMACKNTGARAVERLSFWNGTGGDGQSTVTVWRPLSGSIGFEVG